MDRLLQYSFNHVHTTDDSEIKESGVAVGGKLGFSLKESQLNFHFEQSSGSNKLGTFCN